MSLYGLRIVVGVKQERVGSCSPRVRITNSPNSEANTRRCGNTSRHSLWNKVSNHVSTFEFEDPHRRNQLLPHPQYPIQSWQLRHQHQQEQQALQRNQRPDRQSDVIVIFYIKSVHMYTPKNRGLDIPIPSIGIPVIFQLFTGLAIPAVFAYVAESKL
jgi:hypothetical protein